MLGHLCGGPLDTRYLVPDDGMTWQVDVHEGPLEGVVFAEVELQSKQHLSRASHRGGIDEPVIVLAGQQSERDGGCARRGLVAKRPCRNLCDAVVAEDRIAAPSPTEAPARR